MSFLALLRGMRPAHAWKNVPVAAPLVFGDRLHDPSAVVSVVACVAAFCLVSSAGYLVNDVVDRRADALHPRRRERPVASGALSVRAALLAAVLLAVASHVLMTSASTPDARLFVAGYLATTLAYTFLLRRIPGAGPVVVAGGFVLRVAGGAAAASVPPSAWLLALTAIVALAFGVSKRESEARRTDGEAPRPLRRLTDALLLASVVGYAVYTQAPSTVALHHTHALAWTALPVAAALLEFRRRLRADRTGAGPAEIVARDPILLALGAVWIVAVVVVLRAAAGGA